MYSSLDTSTQESSVQVDINKWKEGLGEKLFRKIFRGFNALAKNQDEEDRPWELYITEGSIIRHMPRVFGYKSEFLAKRFYTIITEKMLGVRVTFPIYMTGLAPLLIGDPWIKHKFIFTLYDVNNDQIIGSTDLVEI